MSEQATADHSAGPQSRDILMRERREDVYILTMNSPQTRNALSEEMMTAIERALVVITAFREVRAVILAANGPVWCSGHDLKQITARREDGDGGKGYYKRLFRQCTKLMRSLTTYPKPIIAAVGGTATAAGCQLVATCDLAVAGQNAQFATPGVNIGLFCATPMVPLARSIAKKHALEMLLTGEMISSERAAMMGLVNYVVPDAKVLDEAIMLGRLIGSKSPNALITGKAAFYAQADLGTEEAYELATDAMVDGLLHEDSKEGIDAFLKKRRPNWKLP
jgi:enoyl-CoA hydratase/carnithine racemase